MIQKFVERRVSRGLFGAAAWLLTTLGCAQPTASDQRLFQAAFSPFDRQCLNDTSELTTLRPLLGQKQIVAIGEVTHGTQQTGQLQINVARDLCQYRQFNVIVLAEVFAVNTLALNQYILFNQGTLADALAPICANQSVVTPPLIELIRWAHQQNRRRSLPERIWMLGTEVAPPNLLARSLLDSLSAHFPAAAHDQLTTLAHTPVYRLKQNYKVTNVANVQATYDQALRTLPGLEGGLLHQWQRLVLGQHRAAWAIYGQDQQDPRDPAMFTNVRWLEQHVPQARLVIINGHNAHIEKVPCYHRDFPLTKRLGHFLAQTYGAAYCAIGTEVDGGFFARGEDTLINPMPTRRINLGQMLGRIAGEQYGLLTLNRAGDARVFQTSKARISFGTSQQRKGGLSRCRAIPAAFDGFVFLGPSKPSRFIDSARTDRLFSVYVALSPAELDSLLAEKRIDIRCSGISWRGRAGYQPALWVQVYEHDSRRRFVSLAVHALTGSNHRFTVPIKDRTRLISVSLVGRNIQACQVDSVYVNGRRLSPANLQLVSDPDAAAGSPRIDYEPRAGGFRLTDAGATEKRATDRDAAN